MILFIIFLKSASRVGTDLFLCSCSARLGTLLLARGKGDQTVLSFSFPLMSFQGHICLATTVSVGILAPTNLTTRVSATKLLPQKNSYLGVKNMIKSDPRGRQESEPNQGRLARRGFEVQIRDSSREVSPARDYGCVSFSGAHCKTSPPLLTLLIHNKPALLIASDTFSVSAPEQLPIHVCWRPSGGDSEKDS